jgi:hypothetical protein
MSPINRNPLPLGMGSIKKNLIIYFLLVSNILFSVFLFIQTKENSRGNIYVANLKKIINLKKRREIKLIAGGKINIKAEQNDIKKFFSDLNADLKPYKENGIIIVSQAASSGKKYNITEKLIDELKKQNDL